MGFVGFIGFLGFTGFIGFRVWGLGFTETKLRTLQEFKRSGLAAFESERRLRSADSTRASRSAMPGSELAFWGSFGAWCGLGFRVHSLGFRVLVVGVSSILGSRV